MEIISSLSMVGASSSVWTNPQPDWERDARGIAKGRGGSADRALIGQARKGNRLSIEEKKG